MSEEDLKEEKILNKNIEARQIKYLNNIIEQDHRAIKRIIRTILGFKSFNSARRTMKDIEAMNIIRKGQIEGLDQSALLEVEFINKLFGLTA